MTAEGVKAVGRECANAALAKAEGILRQASIDFGCDLRVAEDVAPMIATYAEDNACDAIVMGTHGGGMLADILMGSTAMKVVNLVKLPVTLVR